MRRKQEITAKPTMLNPSTGTFEWAELGSHNGDYQPAAGGRPIRRRSLNNIRASSEDPPPWRRVANESMTPRASLEPLPHRPAVASAPEEHNVITTPPVPQRLEPIPQAPQPWQPQPQPQYSGLESNWRLDDLMAAIERNSGEARHSYLRV